jgi:zinc protease
MMFKGTSKHGPNEFSRIIAANGGRENAFTGSDYTAYFQSMEKSRLAVSFELEADRMRGLTLPPKEYLKEIRVVREERRLRTEDKPTALTYEQFMAAAWTSSPYHHPVIGWMDDLLSLKVEDLRAWYQRWYAPNNATVVVVGDVDPKQVLALARKYFGSLKPSKLEPPRPQREPRQRGRRDIVVKAPARVPYMLMGFKVPSLKTAKQDWEPYALEVLAGILDGGGSSRLSRRLVRGSGVATSIGAGYDLYARLQTLFLFAGSPSQGKSVKDLEKAIMKQLGDLRDKPVSDAELQRVKVQVVASAVYERDSMFYQAMQIGKLETVGLGWRRTDEYVKRVNAVTAAQVQAVARKYLVEDGLTVAVLDPQPLKGIKRRRVPAGVRHHGR